MELVQKLRDIRLGHVDYSHHFNSSSELDIEFIFLFKELNSSGTKLIELEEEVEALHSCSDL